MVGLAYSSVQVDGEWIKGRPLKALSSHKRNTDVIELEQEAEVRVQLHGGWGQLVEYFDRTFTLADDEILLIIAIDRYFRWPSNSRLIVEHSILPQR